MLRFVKRLVRQRAGTPSEVATEADLYSCYRLFLRREPDAAGWAAWRTVINGQISVQALADAFLYSDEFLTSLTDAKRPVLVELDAFKIYVRLSDFFIGAVVARDKSYEPHVTRALDQHLKPGAVFVDIGANIGYFTLLGAARVGRHGRVIAFEPNPANCELLMQSVRANGFENVTLHPYAVAERRQTFKLEGGGTNSNGRVVEGPATAVPGDSRQRSVEAVALDAFLAGIDRIDVVKMDIEGAEPRALRGMLQLVRTHRPIIVTEFSPLLIDATSHVTPESYLDQLREHGYDIFILGQEAVPARPPTTPEIVSAHARSGLTHLDLIACPQSSGPVSRHI